MTTYWVRRNAQSDLRENLRTAVKGRGWTLTRAAKEADVPYSRMTGALAAQRWFLPQEVEALAAVLEMSVEELLGESVFKDDPRAAKFDRPPPSTTRARRVSAPNRGFGRALCCACGTFRRFRVDEVDHSRLRHDCPEDLGPRMTLPLWCESCSEQTTHAELRVGAYRDVAEERQAAPTRAEIALAERDHLITRLAEFNVEIHLRGRRKKSRSQGYLVRYEYDDSKSVWRIEIDPNAPARVQVNVIEETWKRIATDDHGDIDWDPKGGVVCTASGEEWAAAADDLVDDISRFIMAERQRLVVDVRDSLGLQS